MQHWNMQQIWLRQERETHKGYNAFEFYLGLGEERTITKVAEHLAVCRQAIQIWQRKYNWGERARAYDNWKAMLVHERVARKLADQADKYSQLASDQLIKMNRLKGLHDAALCSRMALELSGGTVEATSQAAGLTGATTPPIQVNLVPVTIGYIPARRGEESGYIPEDQADTFMELYPDAIVIR